MKFLSLIIITLALSVPAFSQVLYGESTNNIICAFQGCSITVEGKANVASPLAIGNNSVSVEYTDASISQPPSSGNTTWRVFVNRRHSTTQPYPPLSSTQESGVFFRYLTPNGTIGQINFTLAALAADVSSAGYTQWNAVAGAARTLYGSYLSAPGSNATVNLLIRKTVRANNTGTGALISSEYLPVRQCLVTYSSASQVNYVLPTDIPVKNDYIDGVKSQVVEYLVYGNDGAGHYWSNEVPASSVGTARLAPRLYTQGNDVWPVGYILRVKTSGAVVTEGLSFNDAGALNPIQVNNPADAEVYLVAFGTGWGRETSVYQGYATFDTYWGPGNTSPVNSLPTPYAGIAPGYPGLDQVNIRLPASLAGSATITMNLRIRTKHETAPTPQYLSAFSTNFKLRIL